MNTSPYFPTIRKLAQYEIWCNHLSLGSAAKLSPDELFHPFPFGFRTIHATLFHIVEVLNTWTGSIAPTISKPAMIPYDPAMPLDQIATWNAELSQSFLSALDASHSASLLHQDRRLTQFLHLITHGTHHRTQFITMLRLLNIDPPFEAGDFGGWSKAQL